MGKGKSKGRSEWTWGRLGIVGGNLVHSFIHSFTGQTYQAQAPPRGAGYPTRAGGQGRNPPGPGHRLCSLPTHLLQCDLGTAVPDP